MNSCPIKVVHITQALGGVEKALANIVSHLCDRNFRSFIIGPKGNYAFRSSSGRPISAHVVPFVRQINPLADWVALVRTALLLRRIRPHLVHAHSAKGGFIGRLAARWLGIPVVYTPHAFSFLSHPSAAFTKAYILLEKTAKHWTTLLVACSPSERRQAVETVGFSDARTVVWPNAIDPATLACRQKRPFDFPYICTAGRPSYQKNLEMLIEVMEVLVERRLPIKCVVVGAGEYSPLEDRIRQMIISCGLENHMSMLGWLSHDETTNIVAHSICYVTTSRYEGLPLSVLEAMGLSRAVVATDVAGNHDCLVHRETGLLVPFGNVGRMAESIQELALDEGLRERLGRKAREKVLHDFDIRSTIHALEGIYRRVSGNAPGNAHAPWTRCSEFREETR